MKKMNWKFWFNVIVAILSIADIVAIILGYCSKVWLQILSCLWFVDVLSSCIRDAKKEYKAEKEKEHGFEGD